MPFQLLFLQHLGLCSAFGLGGSEPVQNRSFVRAASLSKPGCSLRPFGPVEAGASSFSGLCSVLGSRAEAGSRPACESLSFASPKERNQRKGDPAVCDPFAALRGNLGCSVTGCTAELTARLRRSARTTAVSQFTKRVCPSAHAPPRALRAPGAYRREPANRTSTRAIAALGPACAARGACARKTRPSEAKARAAVRLLGCSAAHPLLAAPAAGRLRGGMGVEAPMLRELTRRGCSSGAAQQQSEFHGAPRNRPAAGLPLRTAKGSQTGGRLSFGYFSLAKQRTSTSAAGPRPGLHPQHKHAANQAPPKKPIG